MPPLIEAPRETSPPTAALFSTKSISSPPSKQPHLSSPSSSPEGVKNQRTAEEENEEDARLASLITEDANWPAWIPIQEVWMSWGLGRCGEGEEGETRKQAGEREEGNAKFPTEAGVESEGSQGKESDSKKLTESEGEEREMGEGEDVDEDKGGGSMVS